MCPSLAHREQQNAESVSVRTTPPERGTTLSSEPTMNVSSVPSGEMMGPYPSSVPGMSVVSRAPSRRSTRRGTPSRFTWKTKLDPSGEMSNS
jgi:hypothetical protein